MVVLYSSLSGDRVGGTNVVVGGVAVYAKTKVGKREQNTKKRPELKLGKWRHAIATTYLWVAQINQIRGRYLFNQSQIRVMKSINSWK